MSNEQKQWYAMAATDGRAELSIYEEIGGWGIGAGQFAADLRALGDVSEIELRINSPGGSVIEGAAIYNLLRQHKARKVVHVDGWAASMASVIAMAGDEIHMPANTWMMIHNPWTATMGDADELRKSADLLDKMRDQIIGAYQRHTELSRDDIAALMDAETWMTGAEAYEKGFATHCEDALEAAALVRPDAFPDAPPVVAVAETEPPAPPAEAAPEETTEPAKPEETDAPDLAVEPAERAPDAGDTVAAATVPAGPERDTAATDAAYDEGLRAGETRGAAIARADMQAKLDEAAAAVADLTAKLAEAVARADALAGQVGELKAAHAKELAALKEINAAEVAGLNAKLARLLPATEYTPAADASAEGYWAKVDALVADGMKKNDAIAEASRRWPSLHAAMLRKANTRPSK